MQNTKKAWNSPHFDVEALVCPISETDRVHAILSYSMNTSSVASLIFKNYQFSTSRRSANVMLYTYEVSDILLILFILRIQR